MLSGLEKLKKDSFKSLRDARVAILANQSSVDIDFKHIIDIAISHGIKVTKIFAPEHGFFGSLQDMEHVGSNIHHRYKVPVVSLYGDHKDSLRLRSSELKDVDILLCDLQDIGSRYYTFHCTISWAMAAVAECKKKLMVVDRPNPISCVFEGNLVKNSQFSFVGAYPLPNRHGFTMGEIANYVKELYQPDLDLEVIWMENYKRDLFIDELGTPFVPTSPNMPTLNTALVYPGMCLLEGTNLSEGRGTTTPFELFGAPFLNIDKFKDELESNDLEGVKFRTMNFRPMFHKHASKNCGGIFIHVTDRKVFKPLRLGLSVIRAAIKIDGFDWRREPYEYETNRLAIDLLLGDPELRLMLEGQANIGEIFSKISEEENEFSKIRRKFLHY